MPRVIGRFLTSAKAERDLSVETFATRSELLMRQLHCD